MDRTIFLQHYRVCLRSDGSPREISHDGAAITYEAIDERSDEAVDLKLVPVESVDVDVRRQFEEQARAAQKLRHINVAKVVDFGREGTDFVYILEHLPGDTLDAWVRDHGPMPADAALRVAEQIVSVLSSASFHRLPYPPIQPPDIMIVPGQTPEGTWPLVKLINFGLPRFTSSSKIEPETSQTGAQGSSSEQIAPSQELARAATDIRSEIYSLGVVLYFLLTGVALSGESLQAAPKLPKFPKPLRMLLARMLSANPDQRPKDLVVLAEMIRQCLLKIERRRAFAEKYGIPYKTTIPARTEARPTRFLRVAIPVIALLLAAAVIAAVLWSEPISKIVHRNRDTKDIGVLVGVPDASSRPPAQTGSTANAPTASAPSAVVSQDSNTAAPSAAPPPPNAVTAANSPEVPSPNVQQPQPTNLQSQPAGPNIVAASPAAAAENSPSSPAEPNTSTQATAGTPGSTDNQASSESKKKSVASSSRRGRAGQDIGEESRQRGVHSVRARVVGITSDGRLILRLPSGRTAFVAPDSEQGESVPRRHRRNVERGEMFAPPPQYEPDVFPED